MVALVIAAVGSFVSCKDYDDDINNLQKQIDNAALKSSVEALQSTLDSKITAAQNAAAAAQTAADKAAATANAAVTKAQLDDAISAAKTAAATAANEYADKVAAAAQTAAAQKAYDDAKAYVDAEVAKVTAAIPSEAAIKAIADASAAALDEALATELKTWVNEQIAAIDVEGQVEAAVAKAIEKIDTAADNVAAIWSAVTAVDLIVSNKSEEGAEFNNNNILKLYTGTIGDNARFGNQSKPEAEGAYDFKKGEEIEFDNNLLIRVTPANAKLTADMIKIIDSKGNDLSSIITIGEPEEFTDLITRGEKTGLWTVPVYRIKDIKDEAIEKATQGNAKGEGQIAYAIAINNTKDVEGRNAVSQFDIYVNYGDYTPAVTYDFKVGGVYASAIHNRWTPAGEIKAEDGSKLTKASEDFYPELKWAKADDDVVIPAYAQINNATDTDKENNVAYDLADARQGINVADFSVKVGQPFAISNFEPVNVKGDDTFVKSYYVTLDRNNAIESDPSEIRAWDKYDIQGLDKVTPASKKLTITINEGDSDPNGDVIGFRLFAVNYDGTLADPDGKAFYVQVGAAEDNSATIKELVWNASSDAPMALVKGVQVALSAANVATALQNYGTATVDASDFKKLTISAANGVTGEATLTDADTDENVSDDFNAANDKVFYALLDKNGALATNWADIASIKVAVNNPGQFVDGKTVSFTINGTDANRYGRLVNKLTVTIKKSLATTIEGKFTFADGVKPTAGVLNIMLYPTNNAITAVNSWAAGVALPGTLYGQADLTGYGRYGDNSDAERDKFQWVFSGAQRPDIKAAAKAIAALKDTPKAAGDVVVAYGAVAATAVAAPAKKYSGGASEAALPAAGVAYAANAAMQGTNVGTAATPANITAYPGRFVLLLNVSDFDAASPESAASAGDGVDAYSVYTEDAAGNKAQSAIGSQKSVALEYNVGKISLEKTAAGADKAQKDYFLTAWSGKANLTYEIADAFQTYPFNEYEYATAVKTDGSVQTKATSSDIYVQLVGGINNNAKFQVVNPGIYATDYGLRGAAAGAATGVYAGIDMGWFDTTAPNAWTDGAVTVNTGFSILDWVKGSNSIYSTAYLTLVPGNYLATGYELNTYKGYASTPAIMDLSAAHIFRAELINAAGVESEYYYASVSDAGLLKIQAQTAPPTMLFKTTLTLNVYVKDCFGIEHKIITKDIEFRP